MGVRETVFGWAEVLGRGEGGWSVVLVQETARWLAVFTKTDRRLGKGNGSKENGCDWNTKPGKVWKVWAWCKNK